MVKYTRRSRKWSTRALGLPQTLLPAIWSLKLHQPPKVALWDRAKLPSALFASVEPHRDILVAGLPHAPCKHQRKAADALGVWRRQSGGHKRAPRWPHVALEARAALRERERGSRLSSPRPHSRASCSPSGEGPRAVCGSKVGMRGAQARWRTPTQLSQRARRVLPAASSLGGEYGPCPDFTAEKRSTERRQLA